MLLYFYLIFALYYFFAIALIVGWKRCQDHKISNPGKIDLPAVSLVVAARNEERNILKLLTCLEEQKYLHELLEVIIVDDQSTDETVVNVQTFARTSELNIKLIHDKQFDPLSPKKSALHSAISQSSGEIILTTDADCTMEKDWVMTMVSPFQEQKVKFVSGPVSISSQLSFFASLQSFEFSSLIGSGAALLSLGYPIMCNGANLAFDSKAFYEVGGYTEKDTRSTGDDVFLMQKIYRRFKDSVVFQKSKDAIVITNPENTLKDFFHQRKRWASKWNSRLLSTNWIIPVFLFVHYASIILMIAYCFTDHSLLPHTTALFVGKLIVDFLFLKKVSSFFSKIFPFFTFIISEIFYPIYTIIIGIAVHFGSWSWKGRSFKK